MEKLKQILEEINNSNIYMLDDYINYDDYNIKLVKKSDYCDEHRWYTIGRWIYRITIDNKNYYFAEYEVDIIKSEMMGIKDCEIPVYCVPVKEVTVVDYVDVED